MLAAGGKGAFSVLGVAEVPMWASPFASLVLTSVIVPRASFLGHLAGIVSGFAVCSTSSTRALFSLWWQSIFYILVIISSGMLG